MPEHQPPGPRPVHYPVGDTTLYGHLIRVGGSPPVATLVLHDGSSLDCPVTVKLARKLGPLLYREVGLEGEATWRTGDWEIVAFRPKRLTEYRPHEQSLTETFRKLAEVSGGRWDHVDADEYMRELRGDDSP